MRCTVSFHYCCYWFFEFLLSRFIQRHFFSVLFKHKGTCVMNSESRVSLVILWLLFNPNMTLTDIWALKISSLTTCLCELVRPQSSLLTWPKERNWYVWADLHVRTKVKAGKDLSFPPPKKKKSSIARKKHTKYQITKFSLASSN